MTENEKSDVEQMRELMTSIFPGWEEFQEDQVIPSILGGGEAPVVSFMVVSNEEAAGHFMAHEEIKVGARAGVRKETAFPDIYFQLEFEFDTFALQFFTIAEGGRHGQQQRLAQALSQVEFLLIWLVDKDKNFLKMLQVPWDWREQGSALAEILEEGKA